MRTVAEMTRDDAPPGWAAAMAGAWRAADRPTRLTLGFCLGHALLWSVALALGHSAPELDSAEQFTWAFSLESGYWKHPPLPSWLMHALMAVFGPSVPLPFVATQACIAIALLLAWQLAREWMGAARALVATVLAALVTYHGLGGDALNHTTVLLPFEAATLWCAWRALHDGRLRWWLLAGAGAGLMMLVKYIAVLPLAALLTSVLLDERLRRPGARRGLAAAAVVFVLLLVPHALWLRRTDFLPFAYARSVTMAGTGGAWRSAADFVLMQCLRVLPALLAAGLLMTGPRRATVPPMASAGARRFLAINALAPLALTLVWGLANGTPLQSRWGGSGFLLFGALLVERARLPGTGSLLRRALTIGIALDALMALGASVPRAWLAERYGIATRANFPSDALAREAQATWRAQTDAPLRLVVADVWLGGNLVARAERPLAVLIDGHHFKSPWVQPAAVARCGALVLDDTTDDAAGHAASNPALEALFARADATGTWALPWAHPSPAQRGARGTVRWAVIRPAKGASCPL